MIHQTVEGQVTWLPGVSPSDFPPRWPAAIDIRVQAHTLGVVPQGVTGTVPLLNGDVIRITPKVGQVNFFRLLVKAGGFQQDLEREFEELVSYSVEADSNLDSLAARSLYLSASRIMRLGSMIDRAYRRRRSSFAVGRVDTIATLRNIATHRQEPVVCRVRERTLDTPENRLLTEALVHAWSFLSDPDRDMLGPVLDKWVLRFPHSRDLEADLDSVRQGFAEQRYGGPRDYYRDALMLAEVVLGGAGFGLRESTNVQGDSILINTADVYERYLRSAIAKGHLPLGYVVSDGHDWTVSLYSDGSHRMVPDIVVSRGGAISLIADAKYKTPDASDHYQMYSYLHATGAEVGLLLSPSPEGGEPVAHKFSASDGKTIGEVYLPLSNLQATEAFLGSLTRQFAQ